MKNYPFSEVKTLSSVWKVSGSVLSTFRFGIFRFVSSLNLTLTLRILVLDNKIFRRIAS